MEELLRTLLRAALPGVAVDWGMNAQSASLPRVVLYRISGGQEYSYSGPLTIRQARVQLDCYAATTGAAKLLARQLTDAVGGLRSGIIYGAFVLSERDYSPDTDGPSPVARVSVDISINFQEV